MMDIACASDDNYVPHCAAMIHSALTSNDPATLTVHFLQGADVSAETIGRLRGFVEGMGAQLVCHAGLEDLVGDLPVMDRIPAVMWYRVLLPRLLPDTPRVLYLDSDTLVVDSIAPLWDVPLDGRYLGAVTNVFEPGMDAHARSIGIAAERYFNSGVLLLNLELMRTDGCTDAIIECARSRSLVWPDQDALNLVMSDKRYALDPRWNCMNMLFYPSSAPDLFGRDQVAEAVSRPGVIHFEGPSLAKPWHYLNRHPRREDYFDHRRATPWPDVKMAGQTWKNRMLRPLPLPIAVQILRLEERLRRRGAAGS